ncbi:MAG: DUF1553 domain-containing protein, partial [Gemmataceae bacterium]
MPNLFGNTKLTAWVGAESLPSLVLNHSEAEQKILTITVPAHGVVLHPGTKSDAAIRYTATAANEYHLKLRLADADNTCGDGIRWSVIHRTPKGLRTIHSAELANGKTATWEKQQLTLGSGECVEVVVHRRDAYDCDSTAVEWSMQQPGQPLEDLFTAFKQLTLNGPAKFGKWESFEPSDTSAWPPALRESVVLFQAGKPSDLQQLSEKLAEQLLKAPMSVFPILKFADAPSSKELDEAAKKVASLAEELARPRPMTHATLEGGVPGSLHAGLHDVKVHLRGRYDRLGELVPRGVPVAFRWNDTPLTIKGSGRLALANWIVDPQNRLTDRVIVNRLWQHHFGEGLVRTASNFGRLGEVPTHPELLDHLVQEFRTGGRSMKALRKKLVLSATYQQSSWSSTAPTVDPDNRLWGYYPGFRCSAEMLRDTLLSTSGDLKSTASGGPSVRSIDSPRRTLY